MYSFTFPGSSYAHSHPFHLNTVTHNALHCIIIRDSLRIPKIRLMLLKDEFSSQKIFIIVKIHHLKQVIYFMNINDSGKMVFFVIVRYTLMFL